MTSTSKMLFVPKSHISGHRRDVNVECCHVVNVKKKTQYISISIS